MEPMAGAALVMGVLCGSLAVVYRCLAADGKRTGEAAAAAAPGGGSGPR